MQRRRWQRLAWGLVLVWACTNDPHVRSEPETTTTAPTPVPIAPQADAAAPVPAPEAASGYRLPPPEVVKIVDAPPTPRVLPSPDGKRLLLASYDALPSIATLAQPFERLAGLRIDTKRHANRRTRLYERFTLVELTTQSEREVVLPEGFEATSLDWSPDGGRFAFLRWLPEAVELWVVEAASAEARRLLDVPVNEVLGPGYRWLPGGQSLLAWLQPVERGAAPERSLVPSGPVVDDTEGRRAPNRTYQDLLRTAEDDRLFEHHAAARLAVVSIDGSVRTIGDPDLYERASASPDGRFVLVERLRTPFSHVVPHFLFAQTTEVRELSSGKVVHVVAELPAAEEIPIDGERTGPRDVTWHPQEPATLLWIEALDEGDPKRVVPHRDRLVALAAPFADPPQELARVQHRLREVSWTEQAGQALLREYDRDRRWTTTWIHEFSSRPSGPEGARGGEPRRFIDRSIHDDYGDPGVPVERERPDGTVVVVTRDDALFFAGSGASPTGDRPFLDRVALTGGARERVFEAEPGTHTEFIDFVQFGGDEAALLLRRETATLVPNYVVRSHGTTTPVTRFTDPHPQLTGIEKRILTYRRKDGVSLSGTLYLPPGYREGDRLPLVVWAYPLEYSDKDTAGQVRAAPHRFTRLAGTSALMFLTQGYAVLDQAAMPIVGDPETMNDTFLRQVVDSARAAVDAVVAEGVADRDRVGIGGHSYGAFMTANLLAHSDLFKAGIARSGAYNRSLTPFGYQNERRTLWEAPKTYVEVSPLFAADRLKAPILLVHGAVDANSGTFPLQSERLFHALSGNGGTARLVVLPHESHGYEARESVLHVLAESIEWFDRYVKHAKGAKAGSG